MEMRAVCIIFRTGSVGTGLPTWDMLEINDFGVDLLLGLFILLMLPLRLAVGGPGSVARRLFAGLLGARRCGGPL